MNTAAMPPRRTVLFLLGIMMVMTGNSLAAHDEVTISYVKAPFNLHLMVMKERGLLEQELAPLDLTARWVDITAGSRQVQALASGDLDIAGAMNSATLLMVAAEGLPIRYIAGTARPTDLFALLARPEYYPDRPDAPEGLASPRDLKGKTVAGPAGTVLHQLLVTLLAEEGLSADDVRFISMELPQAFAALRSGQVDAALLVGPLIIKARAEGMAVLATADGHIMPRLGMAASDSFIATRPEALAAVIRAHDAAGQWMDEHREEAIALGATTLGISARDAGTLFAWSHFTRRFTSDDIAGLEQEMDFLLEHGLMRRRIDVDSVFAPSALEMDLSSLPPPGP